MIEHFVRKARTLPDQNIVQFDIIREQVKDRLLNEEYFKGIQVSSFNFFNKKVKGIRPS